MRENPFLRKLLTIPEQRDAYVTLLQQNTLFGSLSYDECVALLSACRFFDYAPGERIFEESSAGTTLHVIVSGKVDIVKSVAGAEKVISERSRGDIIGEIGFFCETRRSASARAGEKGCEQLVLEKEAFLALTLTKPRLVPDLMNAVLASIGRRLSRLSWIYRNYVLFGYLPDRSASVRRESLLRRQLPAMAYGLAGGVAGALVGALVMYAVLGQQNAHLLTRQALSLACGLTGVCCALLAYGAGLVTDLQRLERLRLQKRDRCCGNCRYIAWSGTGDRFDCVLLLSGFKSSGVRPGLLHDTYTDCTGFDLESYQDVVIKKRDTIPTQ